MRFTYIILEGIREFPLKDISFHKGFNIVCGPNESGKSTILESILYAITGDTTLIEGLKGWERERSSITLKYNRDKEAGHTIHRVLYPHIEATLTNSITTEDREHINTALQDHFHSINRTILEHSVFVKHNEIEILRNMESKEIIKEQMKVVFTGSQNRSVETILQDLKDEISENKRALSETEYRINKEEEKLNQYQGIDEAFEKIDNKRNIYSEDLDTSGKTLKWLSKRIEYGEKLQEIRELKSKKEEIEIIQKYIETLPFDLIREKENNLQELKKIDEQLLKIREELEKIVRDEEDNKKKNIFSKLIDALRGKSLEYETEHFKKSKEDLEYERFQCEKRKEEIENHIKEINGQMRGYEDKNVDDLVHLKEGYEGKIESLLSGSTIEDLHHTIHQKQEHTDNLRKKIFLAMPDILYIEDSAIHDKKDRMEKKISVLKKDIEDINDKFIDIKKQKQEKDEIQNEINSLETKKNAPEKRLEINDIVLDRLQRLYIQEKEIFIPQLEAKTSKLMETITEGKYVNIKIDRENLDVFVDKGDSKISMDSLSQGTKDQLYFSLRISLSELLGGGDLPLLFDESFLSSDKRRVQEIIKLLQEISEWRQIILFTHNEDYLQYGIPILLETKTTFEPTI